MERKYAYISIPITGYDIKERIETSKFVAEILGLRGFQTYNPLDLAVKFPGKSWEWYMEQDLKELHAGVNALFLCPGWRNSRGCKIEYEEALAINKNPEKNIEIYEVTAWSNKPYFRTSWLATRQIKQK